MDSTMTIKIKNPTTQPRLHMDLPGGLRDVGNYREEMEGSRNFAVGKDGWTYTYHDRLTNRTNKFIDYPMKIASRLKEEGIKKEEIEENFDLVEKIENELLNSGNDQLKFIIDKLEEAPHSRRAQAITYIPTIDQNVSDPPCFQRGWFRITKNKNNVNYLNMNIHWRSRDAYKAALMNLDGFVELQKKIANDCSEKMNKIVRPGRLVDISDSFHIYGSYFDEFEERFLNLLEERDFKDRVINTDEKKYKRQIERGREDARNKVKNEKMKRIEKAWSRT